MFKKSVTEEDFKSALQVLEQRMHFMEQKNALLEQKIIKLESDNYFLRSELESKSSQLEKRITDFTDVWHPMMMENVNRIKSELVDEVAVIDKKNVETLRAEIVREVEDKSDTAMFCISPNVDVFAPHFCTETDLIKIVKGSLKLSAPMLYKLQNCRGLDLVYWSYLLRVDFVDENNKSLFELYENDPVHSRYHANNYKQTEKDFLELNKTAFEAANKMFPGLFYFPQLVTIGKVWISNGPRFEFPIFVSTKMHNAYLHRILFGDSHWNRFDDQRKYEFYNPNGSSSCGPGPAYVLNFDFIKSMPCMQNVPKWYWNKFEIYQSFNGFQHAGFFDCSE